MSITTHSSERIIVDRVIVLCLIYLSISLPIFTVIQVLNPSIINTYRRVIKFVVRELIEISRFNRQVDGCPLATRQR